jgi:hypothetical protein
VLTDNRRNKKSERENMELEKKKEEMELKVKMEGKNSGETNLLLGPEIFSPELSENEGV